jgi:hypothetical protein
MKHALIAIALVAAAGGIVIGLRVHEASERAERTKVAVEQTRAEARKLIDSCENRAGVANQIGMATSRFGMYIAEGDRANMQRVMRDLVTATLGAYDMACSGAKSDIAFVQDNVVEPDSWIDVKGEEVAEQIRYLARVRAAVHALEVAVDAAPADIVAKRLDELVAAAKPVPIVLPAVPEP